MRSVLGTMLRHLRALFRRSQRPRGPVPPGDADLARDLAELARRYRKKAEGDEVG